MHSKYLYENCEGQTTLQEDNVNEWKKTVLESLGPVGEPQYLNVRNIAEPFSPATYIIYGTVSVLFGYPCPAPFLPSRTLSVDRAEGWNTAAGWGRLHPSCQRLTSFG